MSHNTQENVMSISMNYDAPHNAGFCGLLTIYLYGNQQFRTFPIRVSSGRIDGNNMLRNAIFRFKLDGRLWFISDGGEVWRVTERMVDGILKEKVVIIGRTEGYIIKEFTPIAR